MHLCIRHEQGITKMRKTNFSKVILMKGLFNRWGAEQISVVSSSPFLDLKGCEFSFANVCMFVLVEATSTHQSTCFHVVRISVSCK